MRYYSSPTSKAMFTLSTRKFLPDALLNEKLVLEISVIFEVEFLACTSWI